MKYATLMFGLAVLLANIAPVRAGENYWRKGDGMPSMSDRNCVPAMREYLGVDLKQAKRMCDPKEVVTDPNEYGWTGCGIRVKGGGVKHREDAICE